MKLVFPDISRVFDTDCGQVPTLVIENQPLLLRILTDLQEQSDGNDGQAVLSADNKPVPIAKHMELLTHFVPFDLNRKALLTKVCAALEKNANEIQYDATLHILQQMQDYLYTLAFDFPCDICYTKLSVGTLIKSVGVEIRQNRDRLPDQLLDYMELVGEFERRKLFVTYNLRSVLSDCETSDFMQTVLAHGYAVLMLESSTRPLLEFEERYVVDEDLCEIGSIL